MEKLISGMTPQEKDVYFAHQEKRHKEEAEKAQAEKANMKSYKEFLIEDILRRSSKFTEADLKEKTIRTLERIFDYA